jgi:hypothetical protein
MQIMWSKKRVMIPITTGANGSVQKFFRKYLSSITRMHEIKKLQKTAILGTAHTIRKVLM